MFVDACTIFLEAFFLGARNEKETIWLSQRLTAFGISQLQNVAQPCAGTCEGAQWVPAGKGGRVLLRHRYGKNGLNFCLFQMFPMAKDFTYSCLRLCWESGLHTTSSQLIIICIFVYSLACMVFDSFHSCKIPMHYGRSSMPYAYIRILSLILQTNNHNGRPN